MDKKIRKLLLLVSIASIIGFFIIFFFSISLFPEQQTPRWYGPVAMGLRGPYPIPIHILIIPSILLTIAIASVSYYFISRRLEEKLENNIKIISKIISKKYGIPKTNPRSGADKNIILKFLNPSERKVVESLIEKEGELLQSEISRTGEMNKLRVHRTVKDLERKNIIKVEKYGKTNRITLSEDVENILLK